MRDGPDIARIAALFGDPARANLLPALMSGCALTAGELAQEAGVTRPTASGHLARLEEAGLVVVAQQGRHRYVRLADDGVAEVLERLSVLAEGRGLKRTRPGPRDAEMRHARSCYRHLAGEMGVRLYDSLRQRRFVALGAEGLVLTGTGRTALATLGGGIGKMGRETPCCRECLDWSIRRMHLAGPLATALLDHVLTTGWAARVPDSRAIRFTRRGDAAFRAAFPVTEGGGHST